MFLNKKRYNNMGVDYEKNNNSYFINYFNNTNMYKCI